MADKPSGDQAPGQQAPVFTPHKWWLHILLFSTTCATTFYAGCYSGADGFSLSAGAMFSSAIMGILLVHELGHYVAARRHRVDASLPYFIPMPLPPIGTFGAVIRMRQPPSTRSALLDIGAAGPLAGLLVAIPVTFIGLRLSTVQPLATLPQGAILEGNSLLYLALKHLAQPGLGPGDDVFLHPLAWAGWIGLLVTSLNLLPAGQLDGGHVLYAVLGRRNHARIARWVRRVVLVMGLFGLSCWLCLLYTPAVDWLAAREMDGLVLRGSGMLPWLVWALLLRYVGRDHPPVQDEETPMSKARVLVGWLALGMLGLTLTPVIWSLVRI